MSIRYNLQTEGAPFTHLSAPARAKDQILFVDDAKRLQHANGKAKIVLPNGKEQPINFTFVHAQCGDRGVELALALDAPLARAWPKGAVVDSVFPEKPELPKQWRAPLPVTSLGLLKDPSPDLRSLAIRTLSSHFQAHPEVRKALAETAKNDSSLAIQSQAQRTIELCEQAPPPEALPACAP